MKHILRGSVAASLWAVAMASPGLAQEASLPPAHLAGTRLDIIATGEVAVVPDMAIVGAGVVTQAENASAAMAENARRMAATTAAIRKAGIADRDIQTTAINLSPQYRYADNQPPAITGYQASARVTVRFRDVKLAGKVLDSLVSAGANQIDGPTLSIDKAEPLIDQARERAVVAAKARAQLYARAAGLQVKRIVAISEGSLDGLTPRPLPMMMASQRSKEADSAIEAGEQKLAISLSVTFELQ